MDTQIGIKDVLPDSYDFCYYSGSICSSKMDHSMKFVLAQSVSEVL